MHVVALSSLPRRLREAAVDAVAQSGLDPAFADQGDLRRYLVGPVFEMGRTYITVWQGTALLGSIGVVVREIARKGEAFLTLLHIGTPDSDAMLAHLLGAAHAVLAGSGADRLTVVKLGLAASASHLRGPLERRGWRKAFRVVEMVRDAREALPTGADLSFRPLGAERLADFAGVHNAAFHGSPNGGQVSVEELTAALRAVRAEDLLQVGYLAAEPAAILELEVRGEVGEIAALDVTPALQGRGLGKAALRHAVRVLAGHGATEVRLQVVDINHAALGLYRASGFKLDRVVSTWYASPATAPF